MPDDRSAVLVLLDLPLPQRIRDAYAVCVRGRAAERGGWRGWIEFVPLGGGPALRCRGETTAASREHLLAWARRLRRAHVEALFELAWHYAATEVLASRVAADG